MWGGYSEILTCVRRLCEKVTMGRLQELLLELKTAIARPRRLGMRVGSTSVLWLFSDWRMFWAEIVRREQAGNGLSGRRRRPEANLAGCCSSVVECNCSSTNQPTYICLYCMLSEHNHHYTQLVHPKIYICLYTIMQYTIVLHITILYQTFFWLCVKCVQFSQLWQSCL